ncbi:signal peptidase I [Kocuria sp.]|uniref:signal peptidase I n=1 Tax=Kocuria sp. TaxID=1871328 RepID=UPI0026E00DF3|nr:signal peptidase I [Kocuria sp.]MDO5366572.1 signal peptidase I [Kocuria sp.]
MQLHSECTEGPASTGSSAVPGPLSQRRWWLRVITLAVLAALLITAVVRAFVVDVYWVGSNSMEPTLQGGDRVLVNKLSDTDELHRGQLVVFDGRGSLDPLHSTDPWYAQALNSVGRWLGVTGSSTAYVKRVMAVPGDSIECCDAQGKITVNGQALVEDYLYPGDNPSEIPFSVDVPADRVWLMGDHRNESVDSRSLLGAPGGGLIRTERIIGTAERVLWPLGRARDL